MKKTTMRASAALLMAVSLAGNAWGSCVSDGDMAALKTAALQQELMVAAFSCHDIALYNRFVRAHQPELIASDARLKDYFVQRDGGRRGEVSYHTYKTELANSSSLRSLQDNAFCDRADADFDLADGHASLAAAVDVHRWTVEAIYRACRADDRPMLADASTEPPPWRTQAPIREDRSYQRGASRGWSAWSRPASGPVENAAAELKTPRPHPALEFAP